MKGQKILFGFVALGAIALSVTAFNYFSMPSDPHSALSLKHSLVKISNDEIREQIPKTVVQIHEEVGKSTNAKMVRAVNEADSVLLVFTRFNTLLDSVAVLDDRADRKKILSTMIDSLQSADWRVSPATIEMQWELMRSLIDLHNEDDARVKLSVELIRFKINERFETYVAYLLQDASTSKVSFDQFENMLKPSPNAAKLKLEKAKLQEEIRKKLQAQATKAADKKP